MIRLSCLAKALATSLLGLCIVVAGASAATMDGEVNTFDVYNFKNDTWWGKATVEVRSPALRYKMFSLYSEPVYTLLLRYGVSRVTLEHKEGRRMTIDVDFTFSSPFGPGYTTFVRKERSDYIRIGQEVAKSLKMIDVDVVVPMDGASATIFRRMPGVLGAPWSWSRDMPGSPAWNRLFVRPLTNIWTAVDDLQDSNYLGAEGAKEAWKKLVEVSKTRRIVNTFGIGNARFDVSALIARINEIDPGALAEFLDPPKPQQQADALVGAYVGAVEALRDENGLPPDPEALRRRRNATVRALNALKDAGLVERETYSTLNHTFWDQAMSGFERRLVALGDEATAALEGSSDPETATPFKTRLAALRAEAEERGKLPVGLRERFDRLASLLDVDCTTFVTPSCEPLIEFAPAEGTTIGSPVADVLGKVKPEYVTALQGRLALMVGEQDQKVNLRSDGTFATKAVLASGENTVSLVLADIDGSPLEGVVLARRTIVYSGRPTKLRVTLTWDTSGSDIDLSVTSPGGSHVSYRNKSAGALRLDVDNTSGYGPENISTEQAEPGDYHIEVVNYSDGVGTTATLHIYKDERLERRESHVFSERGEIWNARLVHFE